ncbi:hypothetical protein [Hymenobacter sp. IS2118]|uniref:hypothetical protein n=1 Tax=Hymenobacter sp. IS2118 TaxID=1505605 RepID=UPI0005585F1A|nr:hypothetical protein [Hymenobacter sp. IS2118]
MRHWLLFAALLPCQLAVAQAGATLPPHTILPALPVASLQPTNSTTAVRSAAGVRYQYQLVHLDNRIIWLAPAWRGQTKREASRRLFNSNEVGELDGLLLKIINELSADGWELLEIQASTMPVEATQKIETELPFNDPTRPVYKGTTSIVTSSETRYLFRKAVVN